MSWHRLQITDVDETEPFVDRKLPTEEEAWGVARLACRDVLLGADKGSLDYGFVAAVESDPIHMWRQTGGKVRVYAEVDA